MRLAKFSLFAFLSVVFSLPVIAEPPPKTNTINDGMTELKDRDPLDAGRQSINYSNNNKHMYRYRYGYRHPGINDDTTIVRDSQPVIDSRNHVRYRQPVKSDPFARRR